MTTGSRDRAIVALFFVSGVAGLLYELLWSRWLGLTFGNTVQSAAIVAGTFTAGLGVGALVGGRIADARRRRAVLAYALCEIGVAVCGAVLAVALPRMPEIAASFTSYARDADGFFVPSFGSSALRVVVSMIVLSIPSALMGATLPLLLRALVDDAGQKNDDVGVRAGVLYGANTFGAACGALACDLVLVPRIGMRGTCAVAIALDIAAALAAIVLVRRSHAPSDVRVDTNVVASTAAPMPDDARVLVAVLAALFFGGAAFLGAEVAWVRFLVASIAAYPAVLAVVLAVVLAGLAIGAAVGGALSARVEPLTLLCATEALFATTLFAGFAFADPARVFVAAGAGVVVGPLVAAASVVLVPSLCAGASYPVANAIVQRRTDHDRAHDRDHVAARAGLITFAITAGDIVGAVAAGFALLPGVGVQGTALVCGGLAALAVAFLVVATRTRTKRMLGALGVAFASCAAFSFLPADHVLRHVVGTTGDVLDVSEGPNETVVVRAMPDGSRELDTDGHIMSSASGPARRYMTMFADVPLALVDDPKDVLVICFGVGNTAHAAALHPSLVRIDVADLSKNVLQHARYFASTNGDVLSDPRVHVYVNDGRNHLWSQTENTYDLVTLEPPPIADAGVSALYAREFYALARSRLKQGGFVTQWLPGYQVNDVDNLRLVRAFLDVFPDAVLMSGYFRDLILVGRKDAPIVVDPTRWSERLHETPQVLAQARALSFADPLDLAASIVGDSTTLQRATENVDAVTDDRPALAYGSTSLSSAAIPASLFDPERAPLAVCPTCASLPHLAPLLEANRRMFSSTSFLSGDANVHFFLAEDPAIEEGIAASPLLSMAFATPARDERRRAFVATQTSAQ